MSGEDQNITLTSMMEAINKLNSNMNDNNDSLRADKINNNNNINNNINNINDNMIKNNQDFNNKFESLQERIELRSRASSKASSRANSQLMTKLTAKLTAEEEPVVMETPRIVPSEAEVSMTAIFKDKADADDFAEVDRGHECERLSQERHLRIQHFLIVQSPWTSACTLKEICLIFNRSIMLKCGIPIICLKNSSTSTKRALTSRTLTSMS
jgi:hypothetical protein